MFNPYQFKAFSQVVREGSFSAAARVMGVSQSAVTQHVANLEKTVGVRLLIRARDGVQLTSTGQEFFDLADRYAVLDAVIDEKLRGYSEFSQGHLRIIANAPQPALQLISKYAALYPDVNIDFALCDWTTAMELLQNQQTDIAIVTDPTVQEDWHYIPVMRARYVLYLRQDHALATRNTIALKELASETLLLPETGSLTQRIVTGALKKRDLSIRRIVKVTSFPVMKEAIMAGLGVGIFLENSAQKNNELRELQVQELTREHETSVVVPNYKLDLRLTQSFLNIL
ncbi:MAG: LysR family transcriptional regulator [Pseudomonadota bacterium]